MMGILEIIKKSNVRVSMLTASNRASPVGQATCLGWGSENERGKTSVFVPFMF